MIIGNLFCRIYAIHDEVKDKAFELEISWVGEGMRFTFLQAYQFFSISCDRTVLIEHSQNKTITQSGMLENVIEPRVLQSSI